LRNKQFNFWCFYYTFLSCKINEVWDGKNINYQFWNVVIFFLLIKKSYKLNPRYLILNVTFKCFVNDVIIIIKCPKSYTRKNCVTFLKIYLLKKSYVIKFKINFDLYFGEFQWYNGNSYSKNFQNFQFTMRVISSTI